MQRESLELERQRQIADAENRAAIRFRERQRAFWHLCDVMCRVERSITDPHMTDAKQIKQYYSALKRALSSLKD
jgi:hypothetical protein